MSDKDEKPVVKLDEATPVKLEAKFTDGSPVKRTRKQVHLPDEVLTVERVPVNVLTQDAKLAPQAITDRVL